jgi:hypothetical protein
VRQDLAVTTEARRAGSADSRRPRGSVRRWIRARPADIIDLFVYVVVLNLAIEYVPSVISESFTLSLLTAALLKIALELVIRLKSQLLTRLRAADTRRVKLAAAVSLWVVAAGSKLVVLELVNLVFGGAVNLGSFISVTLLVVALLVSRGRRTPPSPRDHDSGLTATRSKIPDGRSPMRATTNCAEIDIISTQWRQTPGRRSCCSFRLISILSGRGPGLPS